MKKGPLWLIMQTYEFAIARMIISLAVFLPGYNVAKWSIMKGGEWLGVNLFVVDLLLAYCGIALILGLLVFVRKVILHYVQYAQVAAMTSLLSSDEPIKGSLLLHGIKLMGSRFGSVSLLYIADNLITKLTNKVSGVIKEQSLPDYLKTGIVARWVGTSTTTVVHSLAEVIASYLFRNTDVSLWKGITKAPLQYMKSWKSVLKRAFLGTIYLQAASLVISWGSFIAFLWFFWGMGILPFIAGYIALRAVGFLVKTALVEPYQVASMICAFHEGVQDTSEESEEDELSLSEEPLNAMDLLDKDKANSLVDRLSEALIQKLGEVGSPFEIPKTLLAFMGKRRNQNGPESGV